MDGAVNPASIGISIAIGGALLAVFISLSVAMTARPGAAANRDRTVSIMFGIAILVMSFDGVAFGLILVRGMAYVGLLKTALLLTAAFAVAGMVIGLLRALRSGRAIKTQGA